MAKMFYTMEEAKTALGRTEDEIKILARDGKLREFRDGPRLMFKADQVEALKGTLGPKDDSISLADSSGPISLADSKSSTGSGIAMSDSAGSRAGGSSIKDDTGLGDLGLAGGSRGPGGSRSGSASGINIFNPDEIDPADPSAATAITSNDSGNLDGVGSGSGLLDLTRESDDTSLGAVLDEIGPGKRDPQGTKAGTAVAMAGLGGAVAAGSMSSSRSAPMMVVKPDATAPLFGGLAAGGAVVALFGLFVLSGAVTGARVELVSTLASKGLPIIAGAAAVVVILCGAVGFGVGKVLK